MKVKNLFLLPVFMILMTFQSNAQQIDYAKAMLNNPRYEAQLFIMFEEQSTEDEVEIEVDDNVLVLDLDVNIDLSLGKMKVEILDANGDVVREIKLNSSLTSKKVFAEGSLTERIKQPEPGIWKIKFSPENATSKTKVNYITLFVE